MFIGTITVLLVPELFIGARTVFIGTRTVFIGTRTVFIGTRTVFIGTRTVFIVPELCLFVPELFLLVPELCLSVTELCLLVPEMCLLVPELCLSGNWLVFMLNHDVTAVLLKTPVVWEMTPCRLASSSRIFEYHIAPNFRVKHCKMDCCNLIMKELHCGTLAEGRYRYR